MPAQVRYLTDPACPDSWAAEPLIRRLVWEFGESLSFTWVMGGLARDYTSRRGTFDWLLGHWLEVASETGMPIDPLLWKEAPIKSTYPACMAVKAAQEQADDGGYRYLRELREGLLCFRRKLDTTEALVEEARGAGLDAERFRIDLASHATVEDFGADLELTRTIPDEARARDGVTKARGIERLVFPSACFEGEAGAREWVFGSRPYEAWRDAALAAGATPSGERPPDALDAVRRFGRMAQAEVEAVCDLPGPRAAAELWRLAADWRLRPVKVLAGWLFEPA